jgi:predicted TPR repeat methyltransferase
VTLCILVQDARELAQKVVSLDPSNGHAWHTMGQMEEQEGKLDAAMKCYVAGQLSTGIFLEVPDMHTTQIP